MTPDLLSKLSNNNVSSPPFKIQKSRQLKKHQIKNHVSNKTILSTSAKKTNKMKQLINLTTRIK